MEKTMLKNVLTMLKLITNYCLWFNWITIISTNYFASSRPVSNGPDEPGVFGLPSYPLDGLALRSYRRRQQFNNQRQIQQFRIRQRIQRHLWRQCLQLRLPSNSSQRLRNSRWRLQLPQYTGEEEYWASAPRKQEIFLLNNIFLSYSWISQNLIKIQNNLRFFHCKLSKSFAVAWINWFEHSGQSSVWSLEEIYAFSSHFSTKKRWCPTTTILTTILARWRKVRRRRLLPVTSAAAFSRTWNPIWRQSNKATCLKGALQVWPLTQFISFCF